MKNGHILCGHFVLIKMWDLYHILLASICNWWMAGWEMGRIQILQEVTSWLGRGDGEAVGSTDARRRSCLLIKSLRPYMKQRIEGHLSIANKLNWWLVRCLRENKDNDIFSDLNELVNRSLYFIKIHLN